MNFAQNIYIEKIEKHWLQSIMGSVQEEIKLGGIES